MRVSSDRSASTSEADSIEDRIIVAALKQFEEFGIRKSTIEDIARRAGVDRVTVYRRVGSRDEVVRAVINRETTAVLADLAQIDDQYDTLDARIGATFATVLERARSHFFFARLLTLEPEYALPRMTTDGSATLSMAVFATLHSLKRAVADGLLEDAPDLAVRAETVVRIVHSFVLTPMAALPLDTREQIADFASRYLLPILTRKND
ncbi:TetR/AcrR family transcriptional regulator [Antrihabitans cavernicola]|uniref:TetR/AcrR family transcriptional regulator n=1 Tax=Antrihabitans cavernicola TaxID=2495913 RepID=A0A5A7SFX9_9NOCA|nr:TetR/AcrR family transcriptional regulator [Spelaeibacter cavernicola]